MNKAKIERIFLRIGLLAPSLCLVAMVISALINIGLPDRSPVIEDLSDEQSILLSEAFHLRESLGELVWPGWGDANIPAIVYNEEYAFLVGMQSPTDGWTKVPSMERVGGEWLPAEGSCLVSTDLLPCYRSALPETGETPQAFTVLVGEDWAFSLGTKEWMEISLRSQIQEDLPPILDKVFPYGIAVNFLLGSEETYIAAILHESFHAYQGIQAKDRLLSAETAIRFESSYPWDDSTFIENWQTELKTLEMSLGAETNEEVRSAAAAFLSARAERRQENGLSANQIQYEQQREWVEGLAKYVELEILHQAYLWDDYEPIEEVERLDGFSNYQVFETRWRREVNQVSMMADDEGDGRFYYSGMAQAYLLDQLDPDWKTEILTTDIFLDQLLERALAE